MSNSHIHLIDIGTKRTFPAAPQGTVLSSSIALGWQGLVAELHSLPKSEYPEHYMQGHRLSIMRGSKPITFEWKQGNSILVDDSKEILATVTGVDTTTLTASDFIAV